MSTTNVIIPPTTTTNMSTTNYNIDEKDNNYTSLTNTTATIKKGGVNICNKNRSVNGTDNEHEETASNENNSKLTIFPVPLEYVVKSSGHANL